MLIKVYWWFIWFNTIKPDKPLAEGLDGRWSCFYWVSVTAMVISGYAFLGNSLIPVGIEPRQNVINTWCFVMVKTYQMELIIYWS